MNQRDVEVVARVICSQHCPVSHPCPCDPGPSMHKWARDVLDALADRIVPEGHVAVPVEKLELLKEARDDTSLSDGAFRAVVAALLWPPTPTADDIEWGRQEAERIARLRAAAEGTDQ